MQACIHTKGLDAVLGHNCRCWKSNALVYNSQGPGSREHMLVAPHLASSAPCQWSHTLLIQGEPAPMSPL